MSATATGAAKDVGVYYVTGEAIRGFADLEAKERERCANFATKAVAAGVAEHTVRVAERQGQLMVKMAQAALREVIFHRSRHPRSRLRWRGRLGN